MAVEGDTIWVMSSLLNTLQQVSVDAVEIEASYEIDGYVEGVVAGNGYMWLMSYDNGGEVRRFDPASASVDMRIRREYLSNEKGQLVEISGEGEILLVTNGILKGDGLGHLWVCDADGGSILPCRPRA